MQPTTSLQPLVREAAEGRALWHLGALLNFKALISETGGQYWALTGEADARMAVPLHVHTHEDEIWFVLEGEIAFTIGDEVRRGGPGTFAYIPRHVPHTFQVLSERARWFGIGLSGNLDQWFFETGQPAAALTLPPPAPPPDETAVAALVASLERYGTQTLGPPPT